MMFRATVSTEIIAFTLCIFLATKIGEGHSNLKYFEQIHADDVNHRIVHQSQRETGEIKEVNFKTLGRRFRLILSPKRDVLHHTFQAYSADSNGKESPLHLDQENFLGGNVFGEADSFASLFIEDGLLTGFIRSLNETYYIEPSWRHSPEVDNRMMTTYRASDVNFNFKFDNITYDKPNDSSENVLRPKRQVNQAEVVFRKSRCSLLLVADYGFFITMGNGSTMSTANYLIGLIDRVNNMFTRTIWEDVRTERTFTNMGFVIRKIIIYTERGPYTDGSFCDEEKTCNIEELTKLFSEDKHHKDFCLAHLFTDHKFEHNAGGYAYLSSVCNPEHRTNGNSYFLNCAVTTSNNYIGDKIITRVAELIVSHELAHTWGANHDPNTPECSPGADYGGPFLMSMYSVTGYDVNNHKFSPCSRRSVGTFLTKRIDECFTEENNSICGNYRVEGEEECDGGTRGLQNKDSCCTIDCKLRANAVCSHFNHECCRNCQYTPAKVICRKTNIATCRTKAFCTGHQANCPLSPPLPDKIECQETGECRNGSCIPYCETLQKQSCMCDSMETSCLQCCRDRMNTTCKPIRPIRYLSDGTACMKGMCYGGKCIGNVLDSYGKVERVILQVDVSKTLQFLKDNIVGTVAVITGILWLIAGARIKAIDRKRHESLYQRNNMLRR